MDRYDEERLRQDLLNEIYAGAFSGMPAMLLDEDDIRNADGGELRRAAERYGHGMNREELYT